MVFEILVHYKHYFIVYWVLCLWIVLPLLFLVKGLKKVVPFRTFSMVPAATVHMDRCRAYNFDRPHRFLSENLTCIESDQIEVSKQRELEVSHRRLTCILLLLLKTASVLSLWEGTDPLHLLQLKPSAAFHIESPGWRTPEQQNVCKTRLSYGPKKEQRWENFSCLYKINIEQHFIVLSTPFPGFLLIRRKMFISL